ncbi:maleylpyruvate isomerase family mycothiol-dependent enzyme [Thermomonospora echinospora]|nr:maleylpyruvate isomerase family mycothiol-dependent enzyme [Thermomonospora echinospora]
MEAAGIFEDLAAEHAQLRALLEGLEPAAWAAESDAKGWSVMDVVVHLAQSEELVAATVAGRKDAFARPDGVPLDAVMAAMVEEDRNTSHDQVFQRWRTAAADAVAALRGCPPDRRLAWAALPLSPRTLATTRIAEHWAHAQDIAVPLGLPYPDTARLRHIAWLAHRTLPYAFAVAGLDRPGPVYAELAGPGGELWTFGDPAAPSRITGPAAEFCRVGARRLAPEETTLLAQGPDAAAALRVVRNYAA